MFNLDRYTRVVIPEICEIFVSARHPCSISDHRRNCSPGQFFPGGIGGQSRCRLPVDGILQKIYRSLKRCAQVVVVVFSYVRAESFRKPEFAVAEVSKTIALLQKEFKIGGNTRTSPAVITIALPEALNSVTIGNLLKESGFLLSYNSDYLRGKNWIQICLMGEIAREKVVALAGALTRVCFKPTSLQPAAQE